jgi:hypothetical protein
LALGASERRRSELFADHLLLETNDLYSLTSKLSHRPEACAQHLVNAGRGLHRRKLKSQFNRIRARLLTDSERAFGPVIEIAPCSGFLLRPTPTPQRQGSRFASPCGFRNRASSSGGGEVRHFDQSTKHPIMK